MSDSEDDDEDWSDDDDDDVESSGIARSKNITGSFTKIIMLCTEKFFAFFDESLRAAQKDKEDKEGLKAEVYRLQAEEKVRKREIKPEYVPTEATIKQLFSVQQVEYVQLRTYILQNVHRL